ncbi:MAG: GDP-L-fucose synthase [Gammaproteobacteria bacterium]|nr:GDP-L-fucose synthase [Gammaproteobacteria bacterium]
MRADSKIFVAGAHGMVGSAIVRALSGAGYNEILSPSRGELDLMNTASVNNYLNFHRPSHVFAAAAKVGGILANSTQPAEFLRENLVIQTNLIHAAFEYRVEKLLFLGSTCIYPRLAPQPLKEEYLLTGPLESTNEWYAVAKIAGIKLCQAYRQQYGCDFIAGMPTNLYGQNDNFDLNSSHVVPALIRKFHEAKKAHAPTVTIWGSGQPLREFLHVDDCADACVFLMQHYNDTEIINIGVGQELSIRDLATVIKRVVGYHGDLTFDRSKPDGTPRKLVDTTKINRLGWYAKIPLEDGLRQTYQWFQQDDNAG